MSFFFFMLRRPPRSTLFPTRRSSDLCMRFYGIWSGTRISISRLRPILALLPQRSPLSYGMLRTPLAMVEYSFHSLRSEEHTSELQSHSDLVCRLLLEKKKTRHESYVC